MRMQTIKAILFDFADTLVHTEKFDYDVCLGKMHESLRINGIAAPFESFKRAYFNSRDRFYRETETTLEEQNFAQRIKETLKPLGVMVSTNDKRLIEAAVAYVNCFVKALTIERYLPSLLNELHKKHKLAVVSNMSFAKAGPLSLEKFDIAKYFDAVIISGMIGWRKPNPKIFQQALKALNVKAGNAVFVGDSLRADIEGARQLGIRTVFIEDKSKKPPTTDTAQIYMKEKKSAARPDRTISKLEQLPEALKSFAKS
jgi:putative hydrolase of the HAD superfamily